MSKQSNPSSKKRLPIVKIACVVIVVLSLAFGGFYFFKYQDLNSKYQDLTMSKEDKIKSLISEINVLYNIPKFEEEQPSVPGVEGTAIYTVVEQELENLKKTNDFYKDAQKDDVLVAYKNANVAILYRPSEKRIIKTGSYADASILKIDISVLASEDKSKNIESQLQQNFGKQIKVNVGNPPAIAIPKGLVIDISGKSTEDAKKIAAAIGYEVGQLPAGISAPEDSAFLIIAPNQ